jgi:hypothetical protein
LEFLRSKSQRVAWPRTESAVGVFFFNLQHFDCWN